MRSLFGFCAGFGLGLGFHLVTFCFAGLLFFVRVWVWFGFAGFVLILVCYRVLKGCASWCFILLFVVYFGLVFVMLGALLYFSFLIFVLLCLVGARSVGYSLWVWVLVLGLFLGLAFGFSSFLVVGLCYLCGFPSFCVWGVLVLVSVFLFLFLLVFVCFLYCVVVVVLFGRFAFLCFFVLCCCLCVVFVCVLCVVFVCVVVCFSFGGLWVCLFVFWVSACFVCVVGVGWVFVVDCFRCGFSGGFVLFGWGLLVFLSCLFLLGGLLGCFFFYFVLLGLGILRCACVWLFLCAGLVGFGCLIWVLVWFWLCTLCCLVVLLGLCLYCFVFVVVMFFYGWMWFTCVFSFLSVFYVGGVGWGFVVLV